MKAVEFSPEQLQNWRSDCWHQFASETRGDVRIFLECNFAGKMRVRMSDRDDLVWIGSCLETATEKFMFPEDRVAAVSEDENDVINKLLPGKCFKVDWGEDVSWNNHRLEILAVMEFKEPNGKSFPFYVIRKWKDGRVGDAKKASIVCESLHWFRLLDSGKNLQEISPKEAGTNGKGITLFAATKWPESDDDSSPEEFVTGMISTSRTAVEKFCRDHPVDDVHVYHAYQVKEISDGEERPDIEP